MTDLAQRGPMGQKEPKATPNPARLLRIKRMPCVVCNEPGPSDAHHLICGRYSQKRASDDDTIPLCKICHQWGPLSIHENKSAWIARNGPDYAFLLQVNEALQKEEDEALGDWF